MGKEKPGFLTPKAIANRIKSKGLQKLRWYCQMCEKQCRDENGFKCHTTSESHQRQLLLFADNSKKFMDSFSSEFHNEYINTLKRRFNTKRVHANIVYQEYINDRNHIHMNSTRWLTLTDYVKWLGRKGICVVDETEKGWFVTWIDRDPETMKRQEEIEKKKKLDLDDRQRQQMFLEKQMERDREKDDQNPKQSSEATELKKNENEIIKINFMMKKKSSLKSTEDDTFCQQKIKEEEKQVEHDQNEQEEQEQVDKLETIKEEEEEEEEDETEQKLKIKKEIEDQTKKMSKATNSKSSSSTEKRKHSALDDIITMEEKQREKQNRKDYWLHKNIIVKIITKKLGDKYLKKKAIVIDVENKYTGVVKLIETGSIIKIDQADLETVLPAIGKQLLILNGAYRGEIAILEQINENDFNAKISIASGPLKGRVLNNIQYEDISKLSQD